MVEDLEVEVELGKFNLTLEESRQLQEIEPPTYTSSDPVTAVFQNRQREEARMFCLDASSATRFENGVIPAGGFMSVKTYHSHIFIAEVGVAGQIVLYWQADRELCQKQAVPIDSSLEAEFKNAGTEKCSLHWKDQTNAAEILQGEIEPGKVLDINTHLGNKFLARNTDGVLFYSGKRWPSLLASKRWSWHLK
ncbi:unnamed protein product [Polarella glacialis]|uniref:Uncharacterized protein n=1 Tax=Polarella glacialis TaxID=89957 RepID=A0A813KMP6_POLGL|nr:unnamed protein product [Polarella glacialis]